LKLKEDTLLFPIESRRDLPRYQGRLIEEKAIKLATKQAEVGLPQAQFETMPQPKTEPFQESLEFWNKHFRAIVNLSICIVK
jgi:hypothetical protein